MTRVSALFVDSCAVRRTYKGHLNVSAFRKLGPDPPGALDHVDNLCERLLGILQFVLTA